jgi:hypothetical protein
MCMNMTLVYSIILDMTLLYLIMFSIILFLVYFDYMLVIVRSELYLSIGSYSACSLISWVSGKHCVCNTPGVDHQLSSGFKLKHDKLVEMTMSKSNLWG